MAEKRYTTQRRRVLGLPIGRRVQGEQVLDSQTPLNEPSQLNVQTEPTTISRRRILQAAIPAVIGLGFAAADSRFRGSDSDSTVTSEPNPGTDVYVHEDHAQNQVAASHESGQVETHESGETDGSRFDMIDNLTGALVASTFAKFVPVDAVGRGRPLTATTAATMNGLALGRVALLDRFGGEKGKELAGHELKEIKDSEGLPVPLLVLLSDWSNKHLAFDNEATFNEVVEDALIPEVERTLRPDLLSGTEEEWREYREQINDQIFEETTQIAASSSVIAPIGTTYASSALANQQKDNLMYSFYERAIADNVLAAHENGSTSELAEEHVHQEAVEQADELMNGRWGFSKLCIANGANGNGTFGIGDPPEIYHVLRNPNAKAIGLNQVYGMATAEIDTIGLNAIFLKKAGILEAEDRTVGSLSRSIVAKQVRMLNVLGEKVTDTAKKPHAGFAATVKEALHQVEDEQAARELRSLLDKLPAGKLDFNVGSYVKEKTAALRALFGGERARSIDAFVQSLLDTTDGDGLQTAWQSVQENVDITDQSSISPLATRIYRSTDAIREAGLHHRLVTTIQDVSDELSLDGSDRVQAIPDHAPDAAEVASYAEVLNGIIGQMKDATTDNPDRFKTHAYRVEALLETHARRLGETVNSAIDAATLTNALKRFGKVSQNGAGETHGDHEDGHEPGNVVDRKVEGLFDKLNLHPSAREVFYALTTQIPSVPAITQLLKRGIEATSGANVLESHGSGPSERAGTVGYDLVESASKNAAEHAGNASIFGNGANFTMRETKINEDSTYGNISIRTESMDPKDTVIWNNGYSAVGNAFSLVVNSLAILSATPPEKRLEALPTIVGVLTAGKAKSSIADNVAAYLTIAGVLQSLLDSYSAESAHH